MSSTEKEISPIQYDLKRLNRLSKTPDSAAGYWPETETRLVKSTRTQPQLQQAQVNKKFSPEEIQKLRRKTEFNLWLGLKKEGYENEANTLLQRDKQDVTQSEILQKVTEMVENTPDFLD